MRAYNFGGCGSYLTIFSKVMWLIGGVITWTLILQGVPPIKFGRVRNVKIYQFLTNFRLWSQISPEWIDKSKVGKIRDQLHFIHYCEKKIGWIWATNQKSIGAHADPPNCTFSGDYILTPVGCWPLKFLHPY